MPRRCSVPGCRSNYRDKCYVGKYVSCFGFPSDPKTLKNWLTAIGRPNFVPNYDNAVCAKHFDESSFSSEDMYRGPNGELKVFKFAKPKLKNDAVPSLFMCSSSVSESGVQNGNLDESGVQNMNLDACRGPEVAMPMSTLVQSLDNASVEGSGELLDDTKTCMDFVEVEMKDPAEEDLRIRHGLDAKCDSLGPKTEICGSEIVSGRKKGHCMVKNVDNGRGEYLKNGVACNRNRSNLGKRGLFNCVEKKDIGDHDCGMVCNQNFQAPSDSSVRNCPIPLSQIGETNLNKAGILEDAGSQNRTDATNRDGFSGADDIKEGGTTQKYYGDCSSDCIPAEESGNLVASYSSSGGPNCQDNSLENSGVEPRGSVKVINNFQNICGDISSRNGISGEASCCGNGDVKAKGDRAIAEQENGSVGKAELKVVGGNRGSEKKETGPSGVVEWEVVKEDLFKGLGLVPRGVLHDRSVDRRHCVTGQRPCEVSAASDNGRLPSRPFIQQKTAVFWPSGSAMFDTERFIGEIQRRPAIYDVRSKVYSNRVAKLKYWHEVGKEMYKGWDALDQMERRTLVKELQIKWKSIRDHFMRQLKQNMNGEGPKKKKYVHFDQLQFLTANLGVKRPRHSYKPPKHEPEEEYMELTPELPEERHFSFMTSVDRPDYDEHEVPVAAALLPQQPEDLSYHPKDLSYHHHKELSYHKELEGDRMGNKMFLLSLLPIMERLPDHSNIRARLQLMEVLQAFVAHEDSSHTRFYNYHDEKQSCGDVSLQHSTASHSDSDT